MCLPRAEGADGIDIIDGEADDDDPEVIAGMARLKLLRAAEGEVSDLPT